MAPERGRTAEEDLALSAALDQALAPWIVGRGTATLLFSGGVDSGLLAHELRFARGVDTLTVGRPGSADLAAAEGAAKILGLAWTCRPLGDDDLRRVQRLVLPELLGAEPRMRPVLLALAAALERAEARTVLCGQGADELFLGYAHFRGLTTKAVAERAAADLARLVEDDWPRSQRIAGLLDRTLVAPYLHPEFVAAARAIPLSERLPRPEPKERFRRWAEARGLPREVARRPKRALQYGTGIARWMRTESRAASPG